MKSLARAAYYWCGSPAWAVSAYRKYARGLLRPKYGDSQWIGMISAWTGGLAEKRVLEIGCDPLGAFVRQIRDECGAIEVVGVNPSISRAEELAPGCRVEPGDARSLGFQDRHFDVVVSSSAFEHIQNFDVALGEMHRVLKPGGYLFSHWGPIWSTSYGHHLWATHGRRQYTYHDLILPPWCHLLMTPAELGAHLSSSHPADLCESVVSYVFTSTDQNQLWFDDYERIVAASAFEMLLFKGYDTDLGKRYAELMNPETFQSLRERYPDRAGLEYEGITMLLRKG